MQKEIEQIASSDAIDESVTGEMIESETIAAISAEISDGQLNERSIGRQQAYLIYIYLPLIFLTVALFGGLRLSGTDGSFVFLRPSLSCLVFAVLLLALFFRGRLISVDGWFNESYSTTENLANGAVLLTLFAASVQIFNSLIPEQGLPFWVVAFCFLWVLWNNLFADFDTKRLLRSLGALFGLAFVAKYMLLANLTVQGGRGWLRSMLENPAQQAFTWMLDLPPFAPGTGYIQFFAILLFLLGLFLMPTVTRSRT
ncbi:MAG TPA: hypothetical protein PKD24_13295 [Pyrinomonadaceae bacterium]|nr:hypothetical protein [Pyrinomonadaceae bacterium]HMP66339.1 hypothetical protein [Pyrinomonadaceae bacterium]